MITLRFSLLPCLGLLLAACAGQPFTSTPPPALPTELPPTETIPMPTSTTTPTNTPAPLEPAGTPLPGTPQVEPAATSAFSPQPGDKTLNRGNLFVEDAGIKVQPGNPAQVLLSLSGNRPTPCHQLRVVAGQPDANGVVQVDAYTVTDPNMMCMQVLRPFAEEIPLGPFAPGRYTVVVNGELSLDFSV